MGGGEEGDGRDGGRGEPAAAYADVAMTAAAVAMLLERTTVTLTTPEASGIAEPREVKNHTPAT